MSKCSLLNGLLKQPPAGHPDPLTILLTCQWYLRIFLLDAAWLPQLRYLS